ncbi:MAG: archaeosortase/exosortase family protein [Phycisphaerales bacterium]|nr:archaeosortase/exosortase family protein [Phycisphaerales bacterium]
MTIFVALVIVGSAMELYVNRAGQAGPQATPAQQVAARFGGVLQEWIAAAVGTGLSVCDVPSAVHGTTIVVKSQPIQVAIDCTGIRATWIFWAGVLGFPCAWRSKVLGLLLGLFGVALLNLLRIALLGIVAGYWPMSFETWHTICMQGFLVVFVAPLWIAWMLWVVRSDAPVGDADRHVGQRAAATAVP